MRTEKGEEQTVGDTFELRHRNPVARDFVIVSRVVLLGYSNVSDSAKLTYWVVYSHDWYEQGSGRKGFVFPSIRRLARLRHTSERTVQRHLRELICARLLTREQRPGRPNRLYIEEPSDQAVGEYLADKRGESDTFVGGGVTKTSPHKEEKQKQIKSVNAEKPRGENPRGPSQPRALGDLLPHLSDLSDHRADRQAEGEWLAQEMLRRLGDTHSLGCYRSIAARCSQPLVFEALSLVKDASHTGQIRKSQGALFLTIVRRLCAERRLGDPLAPHAVHRTRAG